MGFLVFLGVIFIAFAEPLIARFTTEPAVAKVAVDCLRMFSYGYAFYGWGMVLVQSFNGAGDTRTPTLVNFFCYWLCQLPLAYTLARTLAWGPTGAFAAVPIAEFLLAITSFIIYKRGKWKLVQV